MMHLAVLAECRNVSDEQTDW